jgi:anion-transporting  ArsA/GET3 family ATPase
MVMPKDVIKVLEEPFNSPCTTEIASIERFVDFVVNDGIDQRDDSEVVIFDTAPHRPHHPLVTTASRLEQTH